MKRTKKRLIRKLKEKSKKFKGRSTKLEYGDFYSIWLTWSIYGDDEDGYISLRNNLSKTVKEYKKNYSDVPIQVLKALIVELNEKIKV